MQDIAGQAYAVKPHEVAYWLICDYQHKWSTKVEH